MPRTATAPASKDQKKKTLCYLKRALELDSLVPFDFDRKTPFCTVAKNEIIGGRLDPETTRALLRSSCKDCKSDRSEEASPVDVVLSLRSLRYQEKEGVVHGLLLVPAFLDAEGFLSMDMEKHRPWVPLERLATERGESLEVMVGELKDYWNFQTREASRYISQVADWTDYVEYAEALFDSVRKGIADDSLTDGFELIDDTCFIRHGSNLSFNSSLIHLYDFLIKQEKLPSLLNSALTPREGQCSDGDIDAGENIKHNMIAVQGSMNSRFPLADSQREAVHAYSMMHDGELLAVSGPPGTGKTTLLQSIVASLIVDHAIKGKDAPLIVGTSATNQAVTNIIESFGNVAADDGDGFDMRWIPRADSRDEPLRSIAAYCPSKLNRARFRERYLLVQPDKTEIYSDYSDMDYVRDAELYFLAQINRVLGISCSSVKSAKAELRRRLEAIKDMQGRVIENAYRIHERRICGETEMLLDEKADWLQRRFCEQQESLKYWNEKMRIHASFLDRLRSLLGGAGGLSNRFQGKSQSGLIESYRREGEAIPTGAVRLSDVVEYYAAECSSLDEERGRAIRAKSEIIELRENYDKDACALRREWGMDVLPGIDQMEEADFLLLLDRALDISLRYRAFWLAVHIFEAKWLEDCEQGLMIKEDDRWKNSKPIQDRFWSQITSLTPCLVMTEYQMPKYFSLFSNTKKRDYDLEKIDLLIVDEAGQITSPVALAALGLAKRSVVVGDERQLSPVWAFTGEADQQVARSSGLTEADWERNVEMGLTASAPSSFMKVALCAGRWRCSQSESGLFLREHYRCVEGIIQFCNELMYAGRLIPSRSVKSRLGDAPPFIFKPLVDSIDQKAGSSRINEKEAYAIVDWIAVNAQRLEGIYETDLSKIIGIVTPFAAQASLIEEKIVERIPFLTGKVTIGTAHKLQGAERSVVLFSCVYGSNSAEASFIESVPELINVAVSRAKDLFVVFGDERRRMDTGRVFGLLNKFSDAGSSVGSDVPSRDGREDARKSISRLVKEWKEHGLIPQDRTLTPQQANLHLKSAGLIMRHGRSSWKPTERGLDIGVLGEEGESASGKYVFCTYDERASQAALKAILDRLRHAVL